MVGVGVLSHKPLIWCAVDRAPLLDLGYEAAMLTQRVFGLSQSIPAKNKVNLV